MTNYCLKSIFEFCGFASVNDRMTGDSTALSVLQCKYRLVVPILSGQHHTKERSFLYYFP